MCEQPRGPECGRTGLRETLLPSGLMDTIRRSLLAGQVTAVTSVPAGRRMVGASLGHMPRELVSTGGPGSSS